LGGLGGGLAVVLQQVAKDVDAALTNGEAAD
jgi:hypothetical protein